MKRNLIFYSYISDVDNFPESTFFHIKYLNLYKDIFTGVKILYVATDIKLTKIQKDKIIDLYKFLDPEIKFVKNNPESRESQYFLDQLKDIKNKSEKNSITFYAHNKGSTYKNLNVEKWTSSMYFFNLEEDKISIVEKELEDKIFAGIFRVDYPSPPWVESNWHFSGTFFWFSHQLFETAGWDNHYIDRFSTESYPGYKVDISKSYNIDNITNYNCDLRYDYYWDSFFTRETIGSSYDKFYDIFNNDIEVLEYKKIISKFPSGWKDHFDFGIKLVNQFKPKVTLELGIDFGFSLFTLSYPKIGEVYGIDSFKGDKHTGYRNTNTIVNGTLGILKNRFGITTNIIEGNFSEVSKNWNLKIDLLHIDGIHAYDDVKDDFETWKKFLHEKSIVLFHDLSFEGVHRFFTKIPGYKIRKGNLGIWSNNYESYDLVEKLIYNV